MGMLKHYLLSLITVCAPDNAFSQDAIEHAIFSDHVRVHIIDLGGQHFDSGHPLSGMIIAVLAYAAQMELDRIRERIRTVLDYKASKGELIGTVPYGYDALETGAVTSKGAKVRRLVPNEAEKHWLWQMAAWRQQGLSYNRIARQLNHLNVPTKQGAGNIIRFRPSHRWPDRRAVITRGKWQCGNVARVLSSKHTKRLLASLNPEATPCDQP